MLLGFQVATMKNSGICLGLHLAGNRRLREDLGRMMIGADMQGLQNIYLKYIDTQIKLFIYEIYLIIIYLL